MQQKSPTRNWVEELSSPGSEQACALAELRVLLTQRLSRSFAGKSGVDDAFLEDVVQESLIKILAALEQFQGRSQFTTWATTIAIRMAIAEMRRLRWKDTSLDQLLESQSTTLASSEDSTDVAGEIEKKQLVEAMYQIIDQQLSEKQRTALLAELHGMPLEEIGRRTGSNRNAVYKLTHDARKRLKQSLVAAGFSAADLATSLGNS